MTKEEIGMLADDFLFWGKDAATKILELTKRHGVICSSVEWSDGTKG